MSDSIIRAANRTDLDTLVAIENACFVSDRLSRRSLKRFLESTRDIVLLAESEGEVVGYVLVLLRRGTRLARLYSIAVLDQARGSGLGACLVHAGEEAAAERGCVDMRLEVRRDNHAAIALYRRLGYRVFGSLPAYYEDDEDALRLQKRIRAWQGDGRFPKVPYFPQSTEFTCGPACLLMALASIDPEFVPGLESELSIWREATTIFMASGHGGCGPHGLALAAARRGFSAEVFVNQQGPLFVSGVRKPSNKLLLEQIHEFFVQDCYRQKIPIVYDSLTVDEIEARLLKGFLPLVLISHYRLRRQKAPHWVVITAVDDEFVYLHDPDVDDTPEETVLDNQYIPIERWVFEGMSRFGQANLRAAVLVGPS